MISLLSSLDKGTSISSSDWVFVNTNLVECMLLRIVTVIAKCLCCFIRILFQTGALKRLLGCTGHSWVYKVPFKSRWISCSELYLYSKKRLKQFPVAKDTSGCRMSAAPSPLQCQCDEEHWVEKNPQFLNTITLFFSF